ncbi:MAG: hypothetical protein RLZZ299_2921 [Pseudomonadota bacterium]|jgi:hypothetical protein
MARLLPSIVLAASLGWLAACGPDPAEQAANAYVSDMEPILRENVALAQSFLELAGAIKKGSSDGTGVALRLAKELRPAAERIHAQARALQPTDPALADLHGQLVAAWAERAEAYKAMSEGWNAGNEAAFEAGRARNLQSKVAEERFFSEVNAWLGAHGKGIEQYP